jgi:hypothetical protein
MSGYVCSFCGIFIVFKQDGVLNRFLLFVCYFGSRTVFVVVVFAGDGDAVLVVVVVVGGGGGDVVVFWWWWWW